MANRQSDYVLEIGRRAAFYMKQRGLTQEALAEQASLSSSTISRILGGQTNPKVTDLKLLADALGVTVTALLGEDEVVRQEIMAATGVDQTFQSYLIRLAAGYRQRPEDVRKFLDGVMANLAEMYGR